MNSSDLTATARYMTKLVAALSEEWGVKVAVSFGNAGRAMHTLDHGQHRIRFGYKGLRDMCENGYFDYKTVEDQMWDCIPLGIRRQGAAHYLVLHEFAHVIDIKLNGYIYGSAHPGTWGDIFRGLATTYLYIETFEMRIAAVQKAKTERWKREIPAASA